MWQSFMAAGWHVHLLVAPTGVPVGGVLGMLARRVAGSFIALAVAGFLLAQRARGAQAVVEQLVGRVAARPVVAVALAGCLGATTGIVIALWSGIPTPTVHDEFSYLLAADTFSHWRLTNPQHPLWQHFETFHVLQRPTYASRYPPAQGLALAAGQILTGRPIIGVWLSAAAASAAVTWMLYGWLRPRWALTGGLLCALNPLVMTWACSYWGGLVALGAGALLLGAMRRLADRVRARYATAMALGMAVLANSRPYEGLVLTVAASCVLVITLVRGGTRCRVLAVRVGLPISTILLATGLWMAYYNYRVTSDPVLMPYTLYERQYGVAPPFVWQPLRKPPAYRYAAMREFHTVWEVAGYAQQRSFASWARAGVEKALTVIVACLRLFARANPGTELATETRSPLRLLAFVTVIPLVAMTILLVRDPWMRKAVFIAGTFGSGLLLETWTQPHYAAPAMSLLFLVLAQGLRAMRGWRWHGSPIGRFISGAVIALYMVSAPVAVRDLMSFVATRPGLERERVAAELEAHGGRSVVIVRYGPEHNYQREFVYNAADIDRAPIVWARDLGPVRNRELVKYYRTRTVWLLEPDARPPVLIPYNQFPARLDMPPY